MSTPESTNGRLTTNRRDLLAFGAALLIAAWLRFFGLGQQPFLGKEAAAALGAQRWVAGQPTGELLQPLSTTLTAMVFFLFGDSNVSARLSSSAAGLGLVAACWWLRPHLSRGGALLAAVLLAVSPLAVYLSRSLSDDMPAAVVFLVLVLGLFSYLDGPERGKLLLMAACVAVLASAGAAGITYLLIFGGYLTARYAAEGREGKLAQTVAALPSQRASLVEAGGVLGLGGAFLASGYLANPEGIGWPSLARFMEQFELRGDLRTAMTPVQVLLGYETLPLSLGVVALGAWGRRAWRRQWPQAPSFEAFLLFWVLAGVLLVTVEGTKSPATLFVLAGPLTLLGAKQAAHLLAGVELRLSRAVLVAAALALLASLILMVNVPQMLRPWGVYLGAGWRQVALALALLAALFAYLDRSAALWRTRAPLLLLLVAGLGLMLHSAVALNLRQGSEWLAPRAASRQVLSLVRAIEERARTMPSGERFAVAVDSNLRYPLAWYLRNTPGVSYEKQVSPGPAAVVTYSSGDARATFLGYLEEQADLTVAAEPPPLEAKALWRWLLYREPFSPVTRWRISLFVS